MNLHRTGYRIIKKLYSQAKAIMAEHHPDPDALKKALAVGHSIDIDQVPGGDPMLYIVDSQTAREKMKEYKIEQPTLLQIIGCSTIIALSEQDAVERLESLLQAEE
jgi:hypothetical protein